MGTLKEPTSYSRVADGGSVMGLGVSYGIGDAGEDFSQEQFGVSIESQLDTDNPIARFSLSASASANSMPSII